MFMPELPPPPPPAACAVTVRLLAAARKADAPGAVPARTRTPATPRVRAELSTIQRRLKLNMSLLEMPRERTPWTPTVRLYRQLLSSPKVGLVATLNGDLGQSVTRCQKGRASRSSGYDSRRASIWLALPVAGSAGHWRAQVAVNHPRKLWGFKSLPAHQSSPSAPGPRGQRDRIIPPWREATLDMSLPSWLGSTSSITWTATWPPWPRLSSRRNSASTTPRSGSSHRRSCSSTPWPPCHSAIGQTAGCDVP